MSQWRDGFKQLCSDWGVELAVIPLTWLLMSFLLPALPSGPKERCCAVNYNFLQNIIVFSSEKPNTGPPRAIWSIWKGLWLSRVLLLSFLLLPFALPFPMWNNLFNVSPVRKSSLKDLHVALHHWGGCTSQGYKTCLTAGGSRYPLCKICPSQQLPSFAGCCFLGASNETVYWWDKTRQINYPINCLPN